MGSKHSIADIKALLQARVRDLVREMAPDGAWQGHTWSAKNPTRDDRKRGSFCVWTTGSAIGAWKDFATGDKGDIIGLIQYCRGLAETKDALAWAENWLGIARIPDHEIKRAQAQAKEREAKAAKTDADKAARQAAGAFAWWLKARAEIRDTPVEGYLATRGIDLRALSHKPGALRFMPDAEHGPSRSFWPAMFALMTSSTTEAGVAVHRTFLARDGSGKAPVDPARMIWPRFKGAAIRLNPGETNMTPREAAKQGLIDTLAICEGIEDGLSLALACPELRIWAAGTLGNIETITVPPCSAEVIVMADNDWGKPQAERALDRALKSLASQGVKVRVARSPIGKDVNDALLSGAHAPQALREGAQSSAAPAGRAFAVGSDKHGEAA
jgi:hypothetical protein